MPKPANSIAGFVSAVLLALLIPRVASAQDETPLLRLLTNIDSDSDDVREPSNELRMYPVNHLLRLGFPQSFLRKAAVKFTSRSWRRSGGEHGSVVSIPGVLRIIHTPDAHREIQESFDAFAKAAAPDVKSGMWAVFLSDAKLVETFRKRVSFDFQSVPMKAAIENLSKQAGIPIEWRDIETGQVIEPDVDEVTARETNVTLRTALVTVLDSFDRDVYYDGARGRMFVSDGGCNDVRSAVLFNIRDLIAQGYSNKDVMKLMYDSQGPWKKLDGDGGYILSPFEGLLIVVQQRIALPSVVVALEELRDIVSKQGTPPKVQDPPPRLVTKSYRVKDVPAQTLLTMVPKFVAADSWSSRGRGKLAVVNDRLVVRQTRAVHRQIQRFLESLPHVLRTPQKSQSFFGSGSGIDIGFDDEPPQTNE